MRFCEDDLASDFCEDKKLGSEKYCAEVHLTGIEVGEKYWSVFSSELRGLDSFQVVARWWNLVQRYS